MIVTDLNVNVIRGGRYNLLTAISYHIDNITITVHTGFVWDGASIPRGLWGTIGCPSDYLHESCLHDALYASCIFSRKDSDKYFHKVMIAMGVDPMVAKAMYLAVRVGGAEYYGKESKAKAREYVSVEW